MSILMVSPFSDSIVFSVHTRKRRFQIAPLWRAFSNGSVFGDRFQRCIVDHSRIRSKTAPFSFENGSVWTGHERKQFVSLGETTSEQLTVKQDVPQGSILGPVLFLLFVNDMLLHVQKSTIDIYADDTTLSLSSNWKTTQSLNQTLTLDLSEVERWARENKIYMNMQKNKSLCW